MSFNRKALLFIDHSPAVKSIAQWLLLYQSGCQKFKLVCWGMCLLGTEHSNSWTSLVVLMVWILGWGLVVHWSAPQHLHSLCSLHTSSTYRLVSALFWFHPFSNNWFFAFETIGKSLSFWTLSAACLKRTFAIKEFLTGGFMPLTLLVYPFFSCVLWESRYELQYFKANFLIG